MIGRVVNHSQPCFQFFNLSLPAIPRKWEEMCGKMPFPLGGGEGAPFFYQIERILHHLMMVIIYLT